MKRNTKTKSPSLESQRAIAEILTELMFAKTMEDVNEIWEKFYKKYDIRFDPFTGTPIAAYDYYNASVEYDKQVAEHRGREFP